MQTRRPQTIYTGDGAVSQLVKFCRAYLGDDGSRGAELVVVADRNTFAAQGEEVAGALQDAGLPMRVVVFPSEEVVADAHHILYLLTRSGGKPLLFVAVGSGTITDITRFVSHRSRNAFVSVPTAPSVDGFTSPGAPLIVGGVKRTFPCEPPLAIFADTDTLAGAPREMIAAGFGDILGKYTSVADWRLGHLLWDEPYDEEIARRTLAQADRCAAVVEQASSMPGAGTAGAAAENVKTLFGALVESGLCMLAFGSSHPASGSEHHHSHFWEMKLLQQGRPAVLHGAKVGVGAVIVAGHYQGLRQLTTEILEKRLAAARQPDAHQEREHIRRAFGPQADDVIEAQQVFLEISTDRYEAIKDRIRRHWRDIQEIARQVPSPETLERLLETAGGPVTVQGLGLDEEDLNQAAENHHYLRQRFTIGKLKHLYGL